MKTTETTKKPDCMKEIGELSKKMQSKDDQVRKETRKRLVAIKKENPVTEVREAVTEALRWRKSFEVELPHAGTVRVSVAHTRETVQRKVKVLHGYKKGAHCLEPDWRNVRDKNGNFVTAPVEVSGLFVTIRFSDGTKISARSCCKAPDVFTVKTAKRRAMHRLNLIDAGIDPFVQKRDDKGKLVKTLKDAPKPHLIGDDHRELLYAILRNGKARKNRKVNSAPAAEEGSLAQQHG